MADERKTLLQKAKAIPAKQIVVTDEHIELALAVLRSEITFKQACIAMGFKSGAGQGYITLTRAIVLAYQRGIIEIKNHMSLVAE